MSRHACTLQHTSRIVHVSLHALKNRASEAPVSGQGGRGEAGEGDGVEGGLVS